MTNQNKYFKWFKKYSNLWLTTLLNFFLKRKNWNEKQKYKKTRDSFNIQNKVKDCEKKTVLLISKNQNGKPG